MFGAARPSIASPRCTVRRSMLNRVRPDVFGTLECSCAPENKTMPPGLQIGRSCGSSSTSSSGTGWTRVSVPIWVAAICRLVAFHSA